MKTEPGFISGRLKSFGFAFAGIYTLVSSQPNAWVHAAATLLVMSLGWLLPLSQQEVLWLVLAVGLVWSAEAFNTAVEFVCDAAVPEQHPLIKAAKDVAACGVLIAAMTAAIIGGIIFLPYFF